MPQLVIAEKPQVGRDIARVMGVTKRAEGFIQGEHLWITWCIGHVVTLAPPDAYHPEWKRWSRTTLPMLPHAFQLEPIKQTQQQFQVIKKLLKDKTIDGVINACDAGREGELIFRFVYELAECRKPIQRLWLSSLTDQAIKAAFQDLRPSSHYDGLADAARCRAEADWLIGLNATRALTLAQPVPAQADPRPQTRHLTHAKKHRAGVRPRVDRPLLSVGRVQTPTLALLVQREDTIDGFRPEPYWQVMVQFSVSASPTTDATAVQRDPGGVRHTELHTELHAEPQIYRGLWTQHKQTRILDQDAAQQIADAVRTQTGMVRHVEQTKQHEKPPLLFDLTQLQRAANIRYGMSAQDTLTAAQILYEKHKAITYPRTDANYVTGDMAPHLPDVVHALGKSATYRSFSATLKNAVPSPFPVRNTRIVNDAEVGDHHAIIPTEHLPPEGALHGNERHVYDLIARRFLAVFYPDAIFGLTRIDTVVVCDDGTQHTFITHGRVRLDAGWQVVEPPVKPQPAAQNQSHTTSQSPSLSHAGVGDDTLLPDVRPNMHVPVHEAKVTQHATKPPPRFTEASLLGAMERAGSTLTEDTLRHAMKESGLGTPATRAAMIETLLQRNYVERQGKLLVPTPQGRAVIANIQHEALKSAQLTGEWEAKLNRMARGAYERAVFMREVRDLTKHIVTQLLRPAATHALKNNTPQQLQCPACHQGQIIRGRRAWGCSAWRTGCVFVVPFEENGVQRNDSDLQRIVNTHRSADTAAMS